MKKLPIIFYPSATILSHFNIPSRTCIFKFLALCFCVFIPLFYHSISYCENIQNLDSRRNNNNVQNQENFNKGEVQVFLPFSGSTEKNNFASISSYLIAVQLGYDKKLDEDIEGYVIINKNKNPIVVPKNSLNVSVAKDSSKNGVIVNIKGVSINEKVLTVSGFPTEFKSLKNNFMGTENFRFSADMNDIREGVIMYVDVKTNKVKAIKKEIPKEELRRKEEARRLEEFRKFENISKYKKNLAFIRNIGSNKMTDISDIVTQNGYLYFLIGTLEILEIFDIKNENSIKNITSFIPENSSQNQERQFHVKTTRFWYTEFFKLKIVGNYAFILNSGLGVKDDLIIVDISDVTSPKVITSYDTGGEPRDLYIKDNYVYLVTVEELQVVDISDIKNLKLIGTYKFQEKGDCFACDVFALRIKEQYAYITAYKVGFFILDISNPKDIKKVFKLEAGEGVSSELAEIGGTFLEIYKNYLFLSELSIENKKSVSIRIFDIKNPISPHLINSIPLDTNDGVIYMLTKNDRLYVAIEPYPHESSIVDTAKFEAVKVFDVSNVLNPKIVGAYSCTIRCKGISLYKDEKYIYLGTSGPGCGLIVLKETK